MKTKGTGKFTSYRMNPYEVLRAHHMDGLSSKMSKKMQKLNDKYAVKHDFPFFMHTEEPAKGDEPPVLAKKVANKKVATDKVKGKKAIKGKKLPKKVVKNKKAAKKISKNKKVTKTKKASKGKTAKSKKTTKRPRK